MSMLLQFSEVLAYCNAQTAVRRLYKLKESPVRMYVACLYMRARLLAIVEQLLSRYCIPVPVELNDFTHLAAIYHVFLRCRHPHPSHHSSRIPEIIGKSPSKSVVDSTMESYARTADDGSYLTYEECQNALLQELQELGAVPILSRM